MVTGSCCQPLLYLGMLVSFVVVEDQMNRQCSIDRLVDPIEKVQEFLVPVSRLAFADQSSFEDIQGSEKCRCPCRS